MELPTPTFFGESYYVFDVWNFQVVLLHVLKERGDEKRKGRGADTPFRTKLQQRNYILSRA